MKLSDQVLSKFPLDNSFHRVQNSHRSEYELENPFTQRERSDREAWIGNPFTPCEGIGRSVLIENRSRNLNGLAPSGGGSSENPFTQCEDRP